MARQATERETPDMAAFRKTVREKRGGTHFYTILLGLPAQDTVKLLKQVEAGFPYRTFVRFQRNVDLPTEDVANLTQIGLRTLARRRETGRLTAEESDRLLRASRIVGKALALFEGDLEEVRSWLARPAAALGDRTPRDVAATEFGAREVESLIGRLEHGVFS